MSKSKLVWLGVRHATDIFQDVRVEVNLHYYIWAGFLPYFFTGPGSCPARLI